MQAAPARYVSASELYSTDEVELLLEEIRELEPTSCRGEDVQDFEIAGSGGGAGAGGRSPAGTDLTERSWDSHAHYSRAPPPRPRPLAPVYCRLRYLATPAGAFTAILVLCSGGACVCTWAALGLRAAAAARPLLFGALSSLLLHALLLVLHVTRLAALLPLHFPRLGGCGAMWSAAWLSGGAGLLLARAPPPHTPALALLHAAAGLGVCGAVAALGVVGAAIRDGCVRRAGAGLPHLPHLSRLSHSPHSPHSPHSRPSSTRSAGSLRAAYRAVPQPSTSRDDPL